MKHNRASVEVDAINYAHTAVLYRSQISLAQVRCNQSGTTELVLHVDSDGNIIQQCVVTANREISELARNEWEKPQ